MEYDGGPAEGIVQAYNEEEDYFLVFLIRGESIRVDLMTDGSLDNYEYTPSQLVGERVRFPRATTYVWIASGVEVVDE